MARVAEPATEHGIYACSSFEAAFRSDEIGAPVQFEDIETEQREF